MAEITTRTIEYKHGGVVLEGYLAVDETREGKRPGVLVCHAWMGLSDFERARAADLARMGYVAFALDIYGKGVRPTNRREAGAQAGKYKNDRELLRGRVSAGLKVLKAHPASDPDRIAAIGYCFGGTTVLELARSGADVDGVVSFHGGLSTPTPEDAKNIKGQVLVLHGADDPHVPADEVAAFQKEMRDAGVVWQMNSYSGAVHSFTNPKAGDDPSKGAAYNERADRRSWQAMKIFFDEIFE